MNKDLNKPKSDPAPFKKRKPKTYLMFLLLSFCVIGYAVGLKYAPDAMPFSSSSNEDDFYAPHAGHCVPELEF
jgi:hypothetical protein